MRTIKPGAVRPYLAPRTEYPWQCSGCGGKFVATTEDFYYNNVSDDWSAKCPTRRCNRTYTIDGDRPEMASSHTHGLEETAGEPTAAERALACAERVIHSLMYEDPEMDPYVTEGAHDALVLALIDAGYLKGWYVVEWNDPSSHIFEVEYFKSREKLLDACDGDEDTFTIIRGEAIT